jgi:hypothetical protein
LYIGGDQIYARSSDGGVINLEQPAQPLLMVGEDLPLRLLSARQRKRRTATAYIRKRKAAAK